MQDVDHLLTHRPGGRRGTDPGGVLDGLVEAQSHDGMPGIGMGPADPGDRPDSAQGTEGGGGGIVHQMVPHHRPVRVAGVLPDQGQECPGWHVGVRSVGDGLFDLLTHHHHYPSGQAGRRTGASRLQDAAES
ncbi:hypothetical protein ACFFX0_31520 [Citricoccus parietis]|uniref:Uncharacterized protein n=1 Tax=Citricoccus parietis TaxID=592307 RepID=A0ABV5G952_9MICC